MDEPTDEGRRRYESEGIYYETGAICTCEVTCAEPCKGECGCQACHDSYMDFLSAE